MTASAALFEMLPGVSQTVYSAADFAAVQRLAHEITGIVLAPGKEMLVYSRISPLVRASRFTTFSEYLANAATDQDELRRVICSLTTNHTYFFREDHHFRHLSETPGPKLLKRARDGAPVRIWSAGCSSGEETWSILTTILGADSRNAAMLAGRDFRVLATDLDDGVLATARAAHYPADALDAMPAPLRKAWVKQDGGTCTINADVRQFVRFNRLNLLHEWAMQRHFDVIFCRNVMIYFDQPTKERLLDRLANQLAPGGYLYIGHSERVTGPAARRLKQIGNTIYKREAA